MPARGVLHLLARLHQQAAGGDLDRPLPAVARPHVQARVAGAAVDGEGVQVVVEARQHLQQDMQVMRWERQWQRQWAVLAVGASVGSRQWQRQWAVGSGSGSGQSAVAVGS